MEQLGLVVILSVTLGGGFGEATATVESADTSSMNVLITVEVESSAQSVVAHLVAPGEPELTLPLLSRGNGRYAIQTDLRVIDYQVVFEALGDVSIQSQPVSLSAMGADLPTKPFTTTTQGEGLSAETRRWGWLALGLVAASLSLLAIWVLGGRDEESDDDESKHLDSAGETG